jgi:hypothetical protein
MTRAVLLGGLLASIFASGGEVTSSCVDPDWYLWNLSGSRVVAYTPDTGSMVLPGPSGNPVSDATVRSAIASAASSWSNANCCTGPSFVPPDIALTQAPSAPKPMDPFSLSTGGTGPQGYNPVWVTLTDYPAGSGLDFATFPGTLAITYPLLQAGQLVRMELVLNGFEPNAQVPVRWYSGSVPPAGCTDGSGCYNVESVATHELGHFIGFAHSSCTGSVMVAAYSGRRTALAVSDIASVCSPDAGYGHATCPCASDAECPLGPCAASASCTAAGCVAQPQPDGTVCSDGDPCTENDTCLAGACTGMPVVCMPASSCHVAGTCDPQLGVCSTPSKPDGSACDDGNECTSDTCQNGTCFGKPLTNGVHCDDGDACTTTDACQGGVCAGTNPVVCSALDDCHDVGTCDALTGSCDDPLKADGTPCGRGQCASGACVAPSDAGSSGPPDGGSSSAPDSGALEPPDAGSSNQPPAGCGCGASPGLLGLLALGVVIRRRRARSAWRLSRAAAGL